ncbi:hypothetical protein J4219_08470 [Candidatus Woesearchaeota archaeon]|nr:hypothetical protein [Candidatus Woesearchaeota archaeon]
MKKGVTPAMLVTIIGLLASLAVMLLVVYPAFRTLLEQSGEEGACDFTLQLGSLAKKYTAGTFSIPPECKVRKISIGPEELNQDLIEAERAVNSYEEGTTARAAFSNDELGYLAWTMEKQIAKEMIECHKRAGNSKLDLDPSILPPNLKNLVTEPGSDYVCLLCSRIYFDPQLTALFPNHPGGFFHIQPWLESNKFNSGKTYLDELYEGYLGTEPKIHQVKQLKLSNLFTVTQPYAVAFVASTNLENSEIDANKGFVGLFPYDKLTSDLGWKVEKRIVGRTDAGILSIAASTFAPPGLGLLQATISYTAYELADELIPPEVTREEKTARCAVIIGD